MVYYSKDSNGKIRVDMISPYIPLIVSPPIFESEFGFSKSNINTAAFLENMRLGNRSDDILLENINKYNELIDLGFNPEDVNQSQLFPSTLLPGI